MRKSMYMYLRVYYMYYTHTHSLRNPVSYHNDAILIYYMEGHAIHYSSSLNIHVRSLIPPSTPPLPV